jgi:small GTP-binding protein
MRPVIQETPSLKVVLIGETKVGKTCILERQLCQRFEEQKPSTVGTALGSIILTTSKGPVRIHLWDTAGQEQYSSLAPMYFRKAHIAVLVFDVTQRNSFSALTKRVAQVQEHAPAAIKLMLVGNKSDLKHDREVCIEEGVAFRDEIGAFCYLETSAKTGDGVDMLFNSMAKLQTDPRASAASQPIDFANSSNDGCC